MTTAVWPTTLPQCPTLNSFSEQRQPNVATFTPDVGPPKIRRRSTAVGVMTAVGYRMTTADVETFNTFFANTLKDGSLPFAWPHPISKVIYTWMFDPKEAPKIDRMTPDTFRVSFNLIRLPPDIPFWNPIADNIAATAYADFTTEGTTNHYWAAGAQQANAAAWIIAMGGSYSRASSGSRYDSTGQVDFESNNVLRFDYDPATLTSRGILLEGTATNLFLQSNTFNLTWAVTEASVAAIGVAWKLEESTTASVQHHIHQTLSKAASVLKYTFSVTASAVERSRILLRFEEGANNANCTFDLAGGQLSRAPAVTGTFSAPEAAIKSVGFGLYRCTLTALTGTGTTVVAYVFLDNGTGTGADSTVYTGVTNNGVAIANAQFELNTPTSYIATATLAVTRSPDRFSLPCTLASPAAATFYLRAGFSDGEVNNFPRMLGANSSGGSIFELENSRTVVGNFNGSVLLTATSGNGPVNSGAIKCVMGFSSSGRSLVVSNGTLTSDANTLTGLNTIFPGAQSIVDTSTIYYGRILELAFWSGLRASDAEIRRLSM